MLGQEILLIISNLRIAYSDKERPNVLKIVIKKIMYIVDME